MRQSIEKLIDDGDFTRIRQIEYQRARYALVKKRAEKERATKFLLQHPDWEQKKNNPNSQGIVFNQSILRVNSASSIRR